MTTKVLSKGNVLEIIMIKFILPTIDVCTDILTIEEIMTLDPAEVNNYQILIQMAYVMIGFLILSFLMMIPHFLQAEKSWKQRLATFLLLFLQIWPQYRAARILWFAFVRVDIDKCLREKLMLERDLSNVEPFIESVPQTHLSLIVVCVAEGRGDFVNMKFLLSFISSVISATLGLSKVLLKGPVKLVSSNRGYLSGYVQLPFFLLCSSVFTCMVGKAAWLPFAMNGLKEIYPMNGPGGKIIYALVWFAMMIVPQALMSFALLSFYCGRRKIWTIIARWPSFLLLPIFSIYSFSGEKIGRKWYLTVSSRWSWINLFISAIGICCGIHFLSSFETRSSYNLLDCDWFAAMIISVPLIILTFIFHSLLTLPITCPSSCIQTPFLQKTALDIDTLEVFNLEDLLRAETDPDLEFNLIPNTEWYL